MKRIIRSLFFLIIINQLSSYCEAQITMKRELTVGDTIQDVEIKNIVNGKKRSIKISEINSKLIILDFWATWCSPCIKAMPKLDSLQKLFGNRILILPVTYEDSASVVNFLEKIKKIIGVSPITVTNDKYLSSRFVHISLPHYVWIDGNNRKVVAITGAEDVDENNIALFLKGKDFEYTLKKDEDKTLVTSPMFYPSVQVINGENRTLEKLSESDLIIHSTLTNYVVGLGSGGSFGDSTRVSLRNMSISSLYKFALFGNSTSAMNTSSVKTEISDPNLYFKVTGKQIDGTRLSPGLEVLEWVKKNTYCYENKVPVFLSGERFHIMAEDLNRYFSAKYGIIGTKERVMRKSLALIRISVDDKMATKGGDPRVQNDRVSFKMNNAPIHSFLDATSLSMQTLPPRIDETKYTGNIDLDLNCDLSNLNALNKELQKYGLKFVEKEAMFETAVIRMK